MDFCAFAANRGRSHLMLVASLAVVAAAANKTDDGSTSLAEVPKVEAASLPDAIATVESEQNRYRCALLNEAECEERAWCTSEVSVVITTAEQQNYTQFVQCTPEPTYCSTLSKKKVCKAARKKGKAACAWQRKRCILREVTTPTCETFGKKACRKNAATMPCVWRTKSKACLTSVPPSPDTPCSGLTKGDCTTFAASRCKWKKKKKLCDDRVPPEHAPVVTETATVNSTLLELREAEVVTGVLEKLVVDVETDPTTTTPTSTTGTTSPTSTTVTTSETTSTVTTTDTTTTATTTETSTTATTSPTTTTPTRTVTTTQTTSPTTTTPTTTACTTTTQTTSPTTTTQTTTTTSPEPQTLAPSKYQGTPAASNFNALKKPPYEMREASGGVVGNRLYVFGGFVYPFWTKTTMKTVSYSPSSNSWSHHPNVPLQGVGISHQGNAWDANSMYLIGGILMQGNWPKGRSCSDALKFTPATNKWTTLPSIPATRGAGAAAVVGRKLHFVGGGTFVSGRLFTKDHTDHWALDLNAQSAGWKKLAPIRSPGRNHLGAASLGGKLYAFGGQLLEREADKNYDIAESYDPSTNKWTSIKSMPWGLGHISPSVVPYAGGILIVGGRANNNQGKNPNRLIFYDPSKNTWTKLPNTGNVPTHASQVSGMIDGRLYIQSEAALFGGKLDPRYNRERREKQQQQPALPLAPINCDPNVNLLPATAGSSGTSDTSPDDIAYATLTQQPGTPSDYTKLGNGGCRTTAVKGPSSLRVVGAGSLEACQALCNDEPMCTAVEWKQYHDQCQLQNTNIVRSAGDKGDTTMCYLKNAP